jgi:hypothetical protein
MDMTRNGVAYFCYKIRVGRQFALRNSQNKSGNSECGSLSVRIDVWQQISLKHDAVASGYLCSRYKRLNPCYFNLSPNARITLRLLCYRPAEGAVFIPSICITLRDGERVIVSVGSDYCRCFSLWFIYNPISASVYATRVFTQAGVRPKVL